MNEAVAPRTRIKICGLTREQDVDAAVAAGVDAVGFVLYAKSARHVTPERAAALARRLPPLVTPVLLFVNASATEIEAAAARLALRPIVRGRAMTWRKACEPFRSSTVQSLPIVSERPWKLSTPFMTVGIMKSSITITSRKN